METYFPTIFIIVGAALVLGVLDSLRRRRGNALEALAASSGLPFHRKYTDLASLERTGFEVFRLGHSREVSNLISVPIPGGVIRLFDYNYTTGSGRASSTCKVTLALIPAACRVPPFDLKPETFMYKIGELIGFKDLDFPDSPVFSDNYRLTAQEEHSVREFFDPSRLAWFERNPGLHVQGMPGHALLLSTGAWLPAEEWPGFIERAKIFAAEVLKGG